MGVAEVTEMTRAGHPDYGDIVHSPDPCLPASR